MKVLSKLNLSFTKEFLMESVSSDDIRLSILFNIVAQVCQLYIIMTAPV